MDSYLETLRTFDISSIPNLDIAVLGALELFKDADLCILDFPYLNKPLVIGSGNAYMTAKIVFDKKSVVFSDESSYLNAMHTSPDVDGVIVFSSSGSKHAVDMVDTFLADGMEVHLVTNTQNSPASKHLSEKFIHICPKNREPYTYNISTYLSMIFGKTREDVEIISQFILEEISPKLLHNFGDYISYTLLIPSRFRHAREMFRTKFDELFGPNIIGRVFTDEEVKHSKTVVTSDTELFISFGVDNQYYGLSNNRLQIPLPENVDYGAIISIGYFVIGKIQASHPPYFKNNIEQYVKTASQIFDNKLHAIVE